MEQHPVPQHIASFEFKLFWNLTVRQFVTLAIPMSLAAAIFFSSLPSLLRYPFSGVIALFAFFAALVPINGRPLDKWLVSFIKAVTSPTQRLWVKEPKIPEFLNIVISPSPQEEKVPETITSQGRERLRAYLRSLPKGTYTPFDVKEQIAVERLGLQPGQLAPGGFSTQGTLPPPIIWPTTTGAGRYVYTGPSVPQVSAAPGLSMSQMPAGSTTPRLQLDEQYEGSMEEALPPTAPTRTAAAPKITLHAKPYALPGLEKKLQKKTKAEHIELAPTAPLVKAQIASETNPAVENVISIRTPDRKIKLIHGVGQTRVRKLHFAPPEGFDLSKMPIRGEKRFEISQELKSRFTVDNDLFEEKQAPAPPVVLPTAPQTVSYTPENPEFKQSSQAPMPDKIHFIPKNKVVQPTTGVTLKKDEAENLEAKISVGGEKTPHIPLSGTTGRAQIVPLTNTPNVISGIVTDQEGNPVESAILIIKDSTGIPVRALKTNKLGQFLSATPLNDGPYSIEVESDEKNFDAMSLMLAGKIIDPLQIKSKN
ncbi:hypothetical protein A2870_04060 [Candidatus Curtissbacteria bacterium RIFCSPHIGHO2_01_FULL_41_11]|uniref:Uncharacterized protein n=1 Tax=Candidatus Curtissbacteria bacterium RIFCSPHIGHO2_01_FULL_41_11 TaxID=1797711 RepID=A0A1F5G6P8_9BACT|nr:MAG: hypothetical protein A2870_04060 [Candidatus Curtissbacteria bacterium RIFCSPHIGHO2_01_FULL_41_11]